MEVKKGAQRCGRLVLVPGPFQGHMTPMLQLGTVLHSKGFSITIAHTKFNSPNPSNHPDFVFRPLSDNLSGDQISNPGVPCVSTVNINCKMEFHEWLVQIMKLTEPNNQLVGIIHDYSMYFVEAVAKDLKLPRLILRPNSASYFLADLSITRLHEEGYKLLQESIQQELVPELYPLRFKDLPISYCLQSTLNWLAITTNTTTSSAVICNTFDDLEQTSVTMLRSYLQVPAFMIGPLNKIASTPSTSFQTEDTSCIKWLDKQAPKSVIYASLGSAQIIDEKELIETAWGLANSDQPFLWVIRPGSVRGSEWIELLPEGFTEKVGERGFIVKWAPQKEVLAHGSVGGFFSHCGWNSTLESISQGVPMICWPCFVDQKVNARYLSYVWRAGLELKQVLERGEIASTIRRLLVDKEGEEVRQRALEMKEKVEACVQEGGSSYKSINDLADFLSSLLSPPK